MRRSFGGGSRNGGGGILRSVHRAVRAGGVASGGSINTIKPTQSSADTNNNNNNNPNRIITLSSSNKSSPFASPPRYRSDDNDWEYVYETEDRRGPGYFDDIVFGTVPSVDEVQHAVTALQKVGFSSNEDEEPLDWIEPPCDSMMLTPCGIDRVGDAFDLLQTDPSVQKMVVSISSDEAVWNAVLNNKAVREFRDSMNEDAERSLSSSSDDGSSNSNAAKDMARWIVNQIQSKVNHLMEKIMMVFHEVFKSSEKKNEEGEGYPFEGKLGTSFFISLVVMLMVVVTRARAA